MLLLLLRVRVPVRVNLINRKNSTDYDSNGSWGVLLEGNGPGLSAKSRSEGAADAAEGGLSPAACTRPATRQGRATQLGDEWKDEMKNENFSQILEISSIFQIFPTLFLKISRHFVISWQFLRNSGKFYQIFAEKSQISSKNADEKWNFIFIPAKIWTVFCWNFEIWAVQKNANLADLENPEKMSIWLLS